MPLSTAPSDTTNSGFVTPIYIHGDAPAPVKLEIGGLADQRKFIIALRSGAKHDNLAGFLNGTKVIEAETNEDVDPSFTVVTDAAATGGANNVANIAGGSTSESGSFEFTLDDLSSLRGKFRVYASVRLTNASPSCTIFLFWYFGTVADATVTNDRVTVTSTSYHLQDLGTIYIPDDSPFSTLTIEMWRKFATTATPQNLRCDYLLLVPADEQLAIATTTAVTTTGGIVLNPDGTDLSLAADGSARELLRLAGPSTIYAPPGMSLLEIIPLKANDETNGNDTFTVAHSYSPQYLA